MKSNLILFGLTASILAGQPASTTPPETVARGVPEILAAVASHPFHPLDESRFTIDRSLKQHGIANLDDGDWRVRLLAVRDLVLAGDAAVPDITEGLSHSDVQARYVSAAALGVLRASSAVPALERVLREDGDALARSQAAIALGQIESAESLDLLRDRRANDSSRDVRHQCELAIDQIGKKKGATPELRAAFASLDPAEFKTIRVGGPAPDFVLPDTEGRPWRLRNHVGESWVVLIWVFADWCPVCHREFRELIEMRTEFEQAGVTVATLEVHDMYRCRVMVGKELDPEYWFARESFQESYTKKIWWPHLSDRAGVVGSAYGIDPMAFSVHAEYINRPATIIVDPGGIVRFAYHGTYWGDRPSIKETLGMIQAGRFDFEHPKRLRRSDVQEGGTSAP